MIAFDAPALKAPAAERPQPRTASATMIDMLLRDRPAILARIRAGTDLLSILRTMIATIVIAMAIVGASLGSYRGDEQIAYAAVKLPLVLLGTAALSAPALWALGAALGRRSRLASDLALVMTGLAFGALVLAACTPLILLGRAIDLAYHRMILVVVIAFVVAGVAALRMIASSVLAEGSRGSAVAILGLCVVFSLVGAQLAWALRPYLVRPQTRDVPFVRDVEGSIYDALPELIRSAQGKYRRNAPVPQEGL